MIGVIRRTLLSSRHHTSPLLRARPKASPFLRLFSSSDPPPPVEEKGPDPLVQDDVSNSELKRRIELYAKGDDEALPSIMEAILKRKLSGKHEDTDDELMDELRFAPPREEDRPDDEQFESDFEDAHSTDDELENLYNARQYVEKKLVDQ